ncbi:MAG: TadE/TadG family type IV pilus assembly protein [Pseudomonadota bacterium]
MRKFLKSEDGGSTLEFVIWMPVFVMILTLIVDVSTLAMTQAHMWRVASDTTRHVALGSKDLAQAADYARDQARAGQSYAVSFADDGTTVSTVITVPVADAAMMSATKLLDFDLSVRVSHRKET